MINLRLSIRETAGGKGLDAIIGKLQIISIDKVRRMSWFYGTLALLFGILVSLALFLAGSGIWVATAVITILLFTSAAAVALLSAKYLGILINAHNKSLWPREHR